MNKYQWKTGSSYLSSCQLWSLGILGKNVFRYWVLTQRNKDGLEGKVEQVHRKKVFTPRFDRVARKWR